MMMMWSLLCQYLIISKTLHPKMPSMRKQDAHHSCYLTIQWLVGHPLLHLSLCRISCFGWCIRTAFTWPLSWLGRVHASMHNSGTKRLTGVTLKGAAERTWRTFHGAHTCLGDCTLAMYVMNCPSLHKTIMFWYILFFDFLSSRKDHRWLYAIISSCIPA